LQKIKDLELENKSLKDHLNQTSERLTYMENDTLIKQDEYSNHYSSLAQTILILEQKNTSLQESLSSETRFKLNLISALGDARRQQEQLIGKK
jgi:predicted  nucleic acid-binding Zn-ribbon protein